MHQQPGQETKPQDQEHRQQGNRRVATDGFHGQFSCQGGYDSDDAVDGDGNENQHCHHGQQDQKAPEDRGLKEF